MTMVFCTCCISKNSKNKLKTPNNNREGSNQMHCGLAWLPLSMAAVSFITIIMTYLFAVCNEHTSPVLPYISDTGIVYPESSIFSLCMDIVAFLLVLIAYVTYYLIGHYAKVYHDEQRIQQIRRVNMVALVVGVVSASGLSVLANFPEDENLMIHLIGAFFCFTFGVAYLFLHTWLSFQNSPEFSPPFMCFVRLTIASVAALTLALLILFGTALRWHANEDNPQLYYRRISAAFEWILVVTLDVYFVTFALEFRKIKMMHNFQHYQNGSWVEFIPLSRSSSETESEDTSSTRSTGSYLVNSNYVINYDVENVCQHNNGTAHILPTGEWCIGWATTV